MTNHARTLSVLLSVLGIALSAYPPERALAAEPVSGAAQFVESTDRQLTGLLRQPESATRDRQLDAMLDQIIDFDELSRRAFGQPCPVALPSCVDHWRELPQAQQTQAKDLLRRLVEKNYRKHLAQILGYQTTYENVREENGLQRVHTEAQPANNPREPPVRMDYVVEGSAGRFHIVDIVTEGSSLTKNYYDQFHRMLSTPGQGFPTIVKKLDAKISEV